MTTIAEKMTAFASSRGEIVLVSRDGAAPVYDPLTETWTGSSGGSFSAAASEGEPDDDDYQGGTLIVRNPVVLIIPNSPAVTFPPAVGTAFTWGGVGYTIARVLPRVLDGAVQYWRVIGGI